MVKKIKQVKKGIKIYKKIGKRVEKITPRKKIKKVVVLRKKIKKKDITKHSKKIKISEKKQLELLKNIVISIAGENSAQIVDILYKKENMNEFLIAKKLDITINQARNILYKLAEEGLVNFSRKKDKKNGGWYTYFWTLDIGKSLVSLKKKIVQEIKELEYQVTSKKTKRFYFCSNCDIEMSEENALLHNFTCPECGEVFQLKDNKEIITRLENNIAKLKEQLFFVDEEVEIIRKKEEVVKERRMKAEAKKKMIERAARRKAKKREMEKNKKIVKKTKKVRKKKKSKKIINKIKKKQKKKISKWVSRKKVLRKKRAVRARRIFKKKRRR
ncbi:MAG: hypothetical protein IIA87_00920 [Nanoarchaeota archaeon]|nr:hypothetical protein [Nanoarchaeota archaeon]